MSVNYSRLFLRRPLIPALAITLALLASSTERASAEQPVYPVISPNNVALLQPVRTLSKGLPMLQWSEDGQTLIAVTETGDWLYSVSASNLGAPPRLLNI